MIYLLSHLQTWLSNPVTHYWGQCDKERLPSCPPYGGSCICPSFLLSSYYRPSWPICKWIRIVSIIIYRVLHTTQTGFRVFIISFPLHMCHISQMSHFLLLQHIFFPFQFFIRNDSMQAKIFSLPCIDSRYFSHSLCSAKDKRLESRILHGRYDAHQGQIGLFLFYLTIPKWGNLSWFVAALGSLDQWSKCLRETIWLLDVLYQIIHHRFISYMAQRIDISLFYCGP